MNKNKLEREARVLGEYIINNEISDAVISRYIEGVIKLGYDHDNKLVTKAIKNPFLLPFLDAALSLSHKNHILQKKLLLMFSVLETTPEYCDFFLLSKKKYFPLISILFIGVSAVFKLLAGTIIYRFLKFK